MADTPKMIAEGNSRVGLFVDSGASAEQVEQLAAVFGGPLGGPMAVVATLIGEMLGVEQAPITCVDDGRLHRVAVSDAFGLSFANEDQNGHSAPFSWAA